MLPTILTMPKEINLADYKFENGASVAAVIYTYALQGMSFESDNLYVDRKLWDDLRTKRPITLNVSGVLGLFDILIDGVSRVRISANGYISALAFNFAIVHENMTFRGTVSMNHAGEFSLKTEVAPLNPTA